MARVASLLHREHPEGHRDDQQCDNDGRRPAARRTVRRCWRTSSASSSSRAHCGSVPRARRRPDGSAMSEVELLLASGPTQVQMPWFLTESAEQCGRQRGRAVRVEIATTGIPHEVSVGEDEQDPVRCLVCEPMADLAFHPLRAGSFGRAQHDEPLRIVERTNDRPPELRTDRQACLVSEHRRRGGADTTAEPTARDHVAMRARAARRRRGCRRRTRRSPSSTPRRGRPT